MKIPMVFKKFTALFTICFAFLLMLPCAGFAEDNHVEAKKNPNATHFPVTGSGKTSVYINLIHRTQDWVYAQGRR